MYARLKRIMSPDLDYGSSPDDPEKGHVLTEAGMGSSMTVIP
ncbi:hypothetical protein [Marinobacter mobilis]